MDQERRARAARSYREVTGSDPLPPVDAYLETTLDAVFGDVWTRPGLARKLRRIVSLTCAACDGAAVAYESHMRAALESGDVSRAEMLELVLHFAHYAGWPRSSQLYITYQKLCAELDAGAA